MHAFLFLRKSQSVLLAAEKNTSLLLPCSLLHFTIKATVMSIRSCDLVSTHFEFILNSLPDGVFITDTEGTTLRVNRMYEQLTGLHQQEIQGKNVLC